MKTDNLIFQLITNNMRGKKESVLNPDSLGNGLESRIRIAQGRVNGIKNYSSIFCASNNLNPITTTQRTWGMPASSNHNLVSYLDTATTLGIASTNINDTIIGTGARQITISGLDSNWNRKSELISLNGQSRVNTLTNFLRINLIIVEDVGSANRNLGDIFISDSTDTFTLGIPTTKTLFAMLGSTDAANPSNISTFGSRSVSAYHRLWLIKGNYYTSATQSKVLVIKEDYYAESSLGNRIQYTGGPLLFSGSVSFGFDGAASFAPKTDYNFKVYSSNTTINGSLYYEAVEEDTRDLTT